MECNICLNNERHPFGLGFTTDGRCYGCYTHEEKKNFDPNKLENLIANIKNGRREVYDCIVPVRGDADDFFVIDVLKRYGLKPLVCYVNSYFNSDIGWKNFQNLITEFDIDSISYNPKLSVYKDMVRYSLAKYKCVLLPYKYIFYNFVVYQGVKKKIPYIVFGENQATEFTGNFSNFDYPEKSLWQHQIFDFGGRTLENFAGSGGQHDPAALEMYNYDWRLAKRIKGVYLSNYISWDSLQNNQKALKHGFQPQKQIRTFDPFYRCGSSVYYEIQDFLRFKKFGYIKARDHFNREIRYGRISRENAKSALHYYESVGYDLDPFWDWLNVSASGREWLKDRTYGGLQRPKDPNIEDTQAKLTSAIEKLLPIDTKLPNSLFVTFDKQLH